MNKIRLRYAPSPTGYLHIGGARTALFCELYARHHNGDFIVRIEDTDIERNVEGGIESQLNNLRWLGIVIDETVDSVNQPVGPYKQTERLDTYQHYAKKLIAEGHAYRCFCTIEELNVNKEIAEKEGRIYKYSKKCTFISKDESDRKSKNMSFNIRIKIPNQTFEWNDMVRGIVKFDSSDLDDYVIIKSNGIPTYNFAVVIDDILMKISHVVRGEEHISNTPKQIVIYQYLNEEMPIFGHLTIITNEAGKKLSKRDTSLKQFIEDYKNSGFIPEAMLNFLALLGWNPKDNKEIMTKEEIIQRFDSDRWGKSPSTFDIKKMLWTNNYYIKKLSSEEAIKLCLPFLQEKYDLSNKSKEWIENLILAYQPQISFGQEIVEKTQVWFGHDIIFTTEMIEAISNDEAKKVINQLKNSIDSIVDWTIPNIEELIRNVKDSTGVKGKNLFMPIRIVTTGELHGPELAKAVFLVGKEECKSRIIKASK